MQKTAGAIYKDELSAMQRDAFYKHGLSKLPQAANSVELSATLQKS